MCSSCRAHWYPSSRAVRGYLGEGTGGRNKIICVTYNMSYSSYDHINISGQYITGLCIVHKHGLEPYSYFILFKDKVTQRKTFATRATYTMIEVDHSCKTTCNLRSANVNALLTLLWYRSNRYGNKVIHFRSLCFSPLCLFLQTPRSTRERKSIV